MAFVPWKDRVTATPHRYKLTEVAPDTYDLEAVPGAISEAGIPVNATNLDRLIQRDGDDIKDTVVAFTEASTRANIATGESTATLFGKVKKYFTDLKAHSFVAPSTTQGTGTTSVPCDNILKESSFARVYRSFADINAGYSCDTPIETVIANMAVGSYLIADTVANGSSVYPSTYGILEIAKHTAGRVSCTFTRKQTNNTVLRYVGSFLDSHTPPWSGWKQIIDDSSAQDITGVKKFTASPIVPISPSGPSSAVAKSYVDSLRTVYDKVIRTQAEFEDMIADGLALNNANIQNSTWRGAKSVALIGDQFELSYTGNCGVKIPQNVKQIHGFNSAKITVTNFVYNPSTAKGGLWYATAPTTQDYSIRDLGVGCTGTNGSGFSNCYNLSNCTGTGTGTYCAGFSNCYNLSNCTGTGTGTNGSGFSTCNYISNCTGTGEGETHGYGFDNCDYISNCTGTGTGTTEGYGFYNIDYAVNCKYGGSGTNMWGGTNTNIDVNTCRRTPEEAVNATLNT